jgi:hypothetical protein
MLERLKKRGLDDDVIIKQKLDWQQDVKTDWTKASCRAHGNNLYGYGGQVLKIWYLKPTKVHLFKSI